MSTVIKQIHDEAKSVMQNILKQKKPTLKFPLRSLVNVKYDPKIGYFEILNKKKYAHSL